jgi:hypothetical protein
MGSQSSRLLVVGLLFLSSTFRQMNAQTANDLSLYQRSLQAYLEAKAEKGSANEHVIVLDNSVWHNTIDTDAFPARISSYTIECLGSKSIRDRYRKVGEFGIVEVLPVTNRDDLLIVTCAEYRVSVRHGKLILGVYGGYRVEYRFDCSKGQYVKAGVEPYLPRM